MKIKSIKPAGEEDAYNMEVADTHDYAIESGVISHNCRYVCMKNPIAPRKRAAAAPKPFDPLSADKPMDTSYEWYRRY